MNSTDMNSTDKLVYSVVEDLINGVIQECRRDHRCISCGKDERTIHCRGAWLTKSRVYETNIDELIDAPLNMGYGSKICKSCTHQTKHCIDCGLSETLMYESLLEEDDTESVVFKECKSEWPIVSRCPDCYERYRRYNLHSHLYYTSDSEEDLYTCERCNREWDGLAQCPCGLDYSSDDSSDESTVSNNEETDPKIVLQGGLIDMINTLDEIKGDIPEGKYLEMMNIMKVMNDSLKKIPEP